MKRALIYLKLSKIHNWILAKYYIQYNGYMYVHKYYNLYFIQICISKELVWMLQLSWHTFMFETYVHWLTKPLLYMKQINICVVIINIITILRES